MKLRFLIVLTLLAVRSAFAAVYSIDSFDHGPKAAAVWRAIDKTPAARTAAGGRGMEFACPFDAQTDRAYWDRAANFDLSPYNTFTLELDCDRPAGVRSMMLYLRSGSGWYVWGGPLTAAGRQTLMLRKSDFKPEGTVAGWNRIDTIRLSVWRGDGHPVKLVLYRLLARKDARLVIKSTASSPNAAERAYAGRVTERVSRLLTRSGVGHAVVTEEEAIAALPGASLAILPCNPEPSPKLIASLRAMTAAGGRAIVCYSSSAALAEAMGVKLGAYQFSPDPGRWRSMAFVNPTRWHVPEFIDQESHSLRPAWPREGRGEVIAWWRDAYGRKQPDPAWVATDRGFWMSHVLLDDDLDDKERMLVGLAGLLDRGVWDEAARHALSSAGRIDSYRDFSAADHAIRAAGGGPAVQAKLDAAGTAYRAMFERQSRGDPRGALDQAAVLRANLVGAYGLVQQPRAGELRAVWDHEGTGWYPGRWEDTCRTLKQRGFNAVFANLLWGGLAHYPSKTIPGSNSLRLYGDQAAALTKAANANGMQAHLWVVCWSMGNAPADFVARMQREGRTQVGVDGKATTWLNPAHPANQQMLLDAIAEGLRAYPFAGVHLDYIRYPGAEYDYSPATRQLFEAASGAKVARWPQDVRPGGARRATFNAWRVQQIDGFVRRAQAVVRATRPGAKLSAAVWGGWPDTINSIGQDWAAWLKSGTIDFVCPMNYTESLFKFDELCRKQLALPNAAGRIYPGIGVTADESQLQPDEVIEQIAAARRLGVPGFILFDLSATLRDHVLPVLATGTTR